MTRILQLQLCFLLAAVAPACPAHAGPQLIATPWRVDWGQSHLEIAAPCLVLAAEPDSPAALDAADLIGKLAGVSPEVSKREDRLANFRSVIVLSERRGLDVSGPAASGIPIGFRWRDIGSEGYVLKTLRRGETTIILIAANSPAGTFYGVQTLKQLVHRRKGRAFVPECSIVDRPAFNVRGIKGLWWREEQYQEMMTWLPRQKLNFFMFCYSMYPETFSEWRRPFSAQQLSAMKRVVDYCTPRYVKVCLSINPSITAKPTLVYSSERDLDTLVAKLKSAYDIGIRSFALCLDDIALELQNEEDKAAFKNFGEAQAHFVNALLCRLESVDPTIELIFCPTTYTTASVSGPAAEEYIRTIGERLPSRVKVFWTGPVVCSPSITDLDADKFGGWIRRNPFIWDNYPVNDYCPNRLYLGAVKNRSPKLHEHVSGWISNPMMQSEASKIPLATIADYLWNPEAYDPGRSFEAAIRNVGGSSAWKDLRMAAELYSDFLGDPANLPSASNLSPRDAESSARRLESMAKRLAGYPELRRLNADLQPILSSRISAVIRRLMAVKPKEWTAEGVSFVGDELSGGAVDVYGSNYRGLSGCNWVYAKSTGLHEMSAKFVMSKASAPHGLYVLTIEGQDDDFESKCEIRISLNGRTIYQGPSGFPDAKWATREFELPAEHFVNAANVLRIENIHATGRQGMPPWFMVRKVELKTASYLGK